MENIVIRKLETSADYHQAEALQHAVWGGPDRLDVIPLHVLVTVQKYGGLVLGAFTPDGSMVAYLLGFLGWHPDGSGQLKHCSHQLGVLPEHRGRGLGRRMKLAQRDEIMKQGLDLITWTYDPLEGPNARLNIARLGATCSTYLREPYGEMDDALNKGVPADRFEVTWWLASDRVVRRLAASGARCHTLPPLALANAPRASATGSLSPGEWHVPDAARFLVAVPPDFQAIKRAERDLAIAWREQTRDLFEAAFAAGYEVRDFHSVVTDGERRNVYLLEKQEVIENED